MNEQRLNDMKREVDLFLGVFYIGRNQKKSNE